MNLETAVKALVDMERRATESPWYGGDGYRIYAPTQDADKRNGPVLMDGKHCESFGVDMELAAKLRNVCLPLLTLVEEGQKLRGLVSEHGAYDKALSAFLAAMVKA